MTIEGCRVAKMVIGEENVEHEQLKLARDSQGNAYMQHCIEMLERASVKSDINTFSKLNN